MRENYANARKVLPARLLRQVQRYWQGLLWIPFLDPRLRKSKGDTARNRRIVRAYLGGRSTADLAERFALSRERIRQIVREAKRGVK